MAGGSAARSPEQMTSSDSSFCRFFFRILTMSVAVQAPSANNTSSIGPGALFCLSSIGAGTQQSTMAAEGKEQPYVIEYYYKTKWGHAEEFLALFKKNHYPVLKNEIELGRMLKVSMAVPRYHTTEDGRWDYRVTIVFKNAAIANDNFDSAALIKQLFPDQESYKKEERRRF